MTTGVWLQNAAHILEKSGVGTSRLDCLVLLEDVLNKDRAHVLADPDFELTPEQEKKLEQLILRRKEHEPLAYIRGRVEFYGREFSVNKNVLIPRPESETMLDIFKKLQLQADCLIADVGSGSGALGISAALERPGTKVCFIDIDPKTLDVARKNATRHGIRAEFFIGDLLTAHPAKYDVLLCNLPYVPDSHTINSAAMIEPSIAIFGGADGLDLYRRLFTLLSRGQYGQPVILTESLPFQHEELTHIAASQGYKQTIEDDFIQQFER